MADSLISIDEAPDDIANKLIALVALARESKEAGEVENALASANRLALKHRINMASISVEDAGVSKPSSEEFVTEDVKVAKGDQRRPPAFKYISDLLVAHFRVRIVMHRMQYFNHQSGRYLFKSGSTVSFIGRKSDVVFAQYAFEFLHHAFTRLWREHKRKTGAMMCERNSFYNGLWRGFDKKLRDSKAGAEAEVIQELEQTGKSSLSDSTAIILVKESEKLEQAVNGFHPVLTTVKIDYNKNVFGGEAFSKGYEKGKRLDVNVPLAKEKHKPEKPCQLQ